MKSRLAYRLPQCLGAIVLAIVLLGSRRAKAESDPAATTAAAVCRHLLDVNSRLKALYVEFQGDPDSGGHYLHKIVAGRQPDEYFEWSAHGSPYMPWRRDPLQQRLTITGNSR
jgi:hypothetical protein